MTRAAFLGSGDERLHRGQAGLDHELEFDVLEIALPAPQLRAAVGPHGDRDAAVGEQPQVALGPRQHGPGRRGPFAVAHLRLQPRIPDPIDVRAKGAGAAQEERVVEEGGCRLVQEE